MFLYLFLFCPDIPEDSVIPALRSNHSIQTHRAIVAILRGTTYQFVLWVTI